MIIELGIGFVFIFFGWMLIKDSEKEKDASSQKEVQEEKK